MQTSWLLLAWIAVSGWACSALAGETPTTRPGARPTNRWYCWPYCGNAEVLAFDERAIWFRAGVALWRYEVRTQRVQSFGPLDRVNLYRDSRFALGPGGELAVSGPEGFVWAPKRGWVPVAGKAFHTFDSGGALLSLEPSPSGRSVLEGRRLEDDRDWTNGPKLVRWVDGQRTELGGVPCCRALIPLADGYVGLVPPWWAQAKGGLFALVTSGLKRKRDLTLPQGWRLTERYFRRDGKVFGWFRLAGASGPQWALCEITSEGIAEKVRGVACGPDFAGGGFVSLVAPTSQPVSAKSNGAGQGGWGLRASGGSLLGPIAPPDEFHLAGPILRDANGHLWCGAWRWDGRRWDYVQPARNFPAENAMLAYHKAGLRLDRPTMAWRPVAPGVPVGLAGYDPKTRTGWLPSRLEQVRIGPDGAREVVRRADERAVPLNFSAVRSPNGDWWWIGQPLGATDLGVCRLVGGVGSGAPGSARVRTYPLGERGVVDMRYPPRVYLGPTGNVWVRSYNLTLGRFDFAADRFVTGSPWEEFSFPFGRWRLSIVGDEESPYGMVHYQTPDGYKRLHCPLEPGEPVLGLRGWGIRGDRMLAMIEKLGVVEHDATADRWVLLHENGFLAPLFDSSGRRLLVWPGTLAYVLCFDGDPFDPGNGRRRPPGALFDELLGRMDSPDWRAREEATRRMTSLALRMPGRLRRAGESEDTPPEVRERLRRILRETPPGPRRRQSLFARMHPPLEPNK